MKFKIQNPAVLVRDCWRQAHIAETDASDHASAACYRSLKDRRIVTMVMPELKFGNKKRHVLLAHLVEGAIAEGSDFLAPACDDRWTFGEMRGREASHASTSSGCHERVSNPSAFGFGNPKSSMALASALRSTSKSCLIAQIDGALSIRCVFDNYIDRSLIVHLTKSGPGIMVNHARRWMTLVHAFGSQIANTWSPTCRGRGAIHPGAHCPPQVRRKCAGLLR
jgi:hypothetical protein